MPEIKCLNCKSVIEPKEFELDVRGFADDNAYGNAGKFEVSISVGCVSCGKVYNYSVMSDLFEEENFKWI